MAFDILTDFNEIIKECNIYGTVGTQWFKPRVNLLVDIPSDVTISSVGDFTVSTMTASGASYARLQMGFFPQTNLEKLDDQIVLHCNRGTSMNVPSAFPSQEAHWIIDDDCKTTSGTSTKLPH